MSKLSQLLAEYLSSTGRPVCLPDNEGVFTFDAGNDMLLCTSEPGCNGLELLASPGYMSAVELASTPARLQQDINEDGNSDDDEDLLEYWQADRAAWSVSLDRESGLVALTALSFEAPWNLDGFVAVIESFREVYLAWEARLRPTRDPETSVVPAGAQAAFELASFLRG